MVADGYGSRMGCGFLNGMSTLGNIYDSVVQDLVGLFVLGCVGRGGIVLLTWWAAHCKGFLFAAGYISGA